MFTVDVLLADEKGWPLVRELLRDEKISNRERKRIERAYPEFWVTVEKPTQKDYVS